MIRKVAFAMQLLLFFFGAIGTGEFMGTCDSSFVGPRV